MQKSTLIKVTPLFILLSICSRYTFTLLPQELLISLQIYFSYVDHNSELLESILKNVLPGIDVDTPAEFNPGIITGVILGNRSRGLGPIGDCTI